MAITLNEVKAKTNQKTFSKLSFVNGIIALGLLTYLFFSFPAKIKVSEGFPEASIALIVATRIFCLTGIVLTAFSFAKKEPSSWFKWIGAFINVLLLLTIIGAVVLAFYL